MIPTWAPRHPGCPSSFSLLRERISPGKAAPHALLYFSFPSSGLWETLTNSLPPTNSGKTACSNGSVSLRSTIRAAGQPAAVSLLPFNLSDLRLCPLGLLSSKNLEEPCQALWFFECRMRQRVGDLQFFYSFPHNPSSNLHFFPFIPSMWVKTYTKLSLVISHLILKYGKSLNILRRPQPKLRIKYFGFSTQL